MVQVLEHDLEDTCTIYRGTIVDIADGATLHTAEQKLRFIRDGALIVNSAGIILDCVQFSQISPTSNDIIIDTRPGYILPGFVDTHLHFAQTFSVHSWAQGNLLRWLDECIFPDEIRLQDPEFATVIAKAFVTRRIAAGTTAALVMGSAFPQAQDALYEQTRQAGLRIISGRGIQTIGPASARDLIFSESDSLAMVQEEITAWHDPQSLIQVGIMPRFALSITVETLRNLAELYYSGPTGLYFHTHLSESATDEIPTVLQEYGVESYLDVFDNKLGKNFGSYRQSFLGPRTIFAHAVHVDEQDLARLAATASSIAHCPVSQLFLGSGTMPWRQVVNSGVCCALGSDIGAGDVWVIPQVANTAFKVHAAPETGNPHFLNPAQLLYLSTLAGAQVLDESERYGNFSIGKEADFIIIDPAASQKLYDSLRYKNDQQSTPHNSEYASRVLRGDSVDWTVEQELFALLMGIDETVISEIFVRGKKCITPGLP